MNLKEALNNSLWKQHKIGYLYSMKNRDSSISMNWKIVYYPLFEDHKGEQFGEPRVLIERPMERGIDFREVPIRFLSIMQKA